MIRGTLSQMILKYRMRKSGVVIAPHVHMNNVVCGKYVNFAHHAEVSNSTIGDRSSVGRYAKIQNAEIGKFCSISWDVTIGALEHPISSISMHAFPYRKQFNLCEEDTQIKHDSVYIGNDVWIGCGAIIMPGVHIGNGSIIGAGAVVTKDVNPYEIVAGVPAKHIRYRFSDDIICDLEKSKWWDLPDNILKSNIGLFSPEIDLTASPEVLQKLKDICALNNSNNS